MNGSSDSARRLRYDRTVGEEGASRIPAAFPETWDPVEEGLALSRVKEAIFRRSSSSVALSRYEVLRPLGSGGNGVVYAARDPVLGRDVAVKIVRTGSHVSPAATTRLVREAQALARLTHPNVITIYDVGHVADRAQSGGGTWQPGNIFIVMELVDGVTLQEWLRAARPWPEILERFEEAGRGLDAAHQVGLVHRDFKPSNAMIGSDGRVRVLDFGIAALYDDAGATPGAPSTGEAWSQDITASNAIGTPKFMAPEQYAAGEADRRTDQFSFCVALYEALYGRSPYHAQGELELFDEKHHHRVARPPDETAVPREVFKVVLRGLSPDPRDRFRTMADLVEVLRSIRTKRRGGAAWRWSALAVALGGLGWSLHAIVPTPKPERVETSDWSRDLAALPVRDELQRVEDLRREARYDDALMLAKHTVELAASVADPGLHAEAWLALGHLQAETGAYEEAEETLGRAFWAADEADDAATASRAAIRLVSVIGTDRARPRDGLQWERHARSALQRIDDPTLEGMLESNVAQVHGALGDWTKALEHAEASVRVLSVGVGARQRPMAVAHNILGTAAQNLGDLDRARSAFARAHEIFSAAQGPKHPDAAKVLGNLANVARLQGRLDEAVATQRASMAQLESALGASHESVGIARLNLAEYLEDMGQLDEARAEIDAALAIFGGSAEPHPELRASAEYMLGDLAQRQSDQSRAATHFQRARIQWQALLGDDHPSTRLATLAWAAAQANLGEDDRARTVAQQVVDSCERAEPVAPDEIVLCADALFIVARVTTPRTDAAETAALRALTTYRRDPAWSAQANEVEAWLDSK